MHLRRSLCVSLALAAGFVHAETPLPALSGSLSIGGSGGWDYVAVDPASHLLYVSHETRMHVLDTGAGKVVAEIRGTPGVHGIAFAPEAGRGFITCGKDGSLAVIDLKTSREVGRIKAVATKPDAVAYDPASGRIFVMDNDGNQLVAVDPKTLKIVGKVALAGAPETGQPDGTGRLFVNLEDAGEVQVVDTRALTVLATWSLAPHATPTGMALDRTGGRLFIGCRSGSLVVMDTGKGTILAALPIGAGVDACAYDPALGRAYASCKDGTVAVVEAGEGRYRSAGTLKTERGSKTLALDPTTGHLFVPAAGGPGTPGDPKAGFQVLEYATHR
jgi:DNA-binding beta-propeller fold protein YncE